MTGDPNPPTRTGLLALRQARSGLLALRRGLALGAEALQRAGLAEGSLQPPPATPRPSAPLPSFFATERSLGGGH